MSEELRLVTELAIILIAAGVFTVISKALKQPLILGYIVAGFLVGPSLGIFPQFSPESVHQWSEIGIIFLLFNLGLEFSFKKLLKVGSAALITAGTICVGMFVLGMLTGSAMGWTSMESIFLGGLLSMSSTTIIIKAYDDMGLKNKPYASLIFGSLVFEDLIAVLMLVLLSTMAVSNKFAGGEMLMALGKLAFFLVLCFLVGIYLIPTLLKKARKYITDEILLIVSIGLCFGMVVLANAVGFSSALGAFMMGSILAETIEGEHIQKLTSKIKDLFGAIFFVSVGMMVDPHIIAQYWPNILVLAIVAVGGILLFSTTGVLIAGKGLDTAVHTGFTMAQLGEFAFIIAGLGCSMGVMRDFIYPVVIAVSVITTFTTPYMIKAADPTLAFLKRKLPAKVLAVVDPPQDDTPANSMAEQSEWKKLLKSYALRVGLYSVILLAIILACNAFLDKAVTGIFPSIGEGARKWIELIVTLLLMSPFLYGMTILNGSLAKPAKHLLSEKPSNRWPILSLMTLRILIGIAFIVAVVQRYYNVAGWSALLLVLLSFLFFAFSNGVSQNLDVLTQRLNLLLKVLYDRIVFRIVVEEAHVVFVSGKLLLHCVVLFLEGILVFLQVQLRCPSDDADILHQWVDYLTESIVNLVFILERNVSDRSELILERLKSSLIFLVIACRLPSLDFLYYSHLCSLVCLLFFILGSVGLFAGVEKRIASCTECCPEFIGIFSWYRTYLFPFLLQVLEFCSSGLPLS